MDEPVILFDGVWKKFRKGERHDSLRDLIPATAKAMLGRRVRKELEDQEFWALRDVSFEVKPGEALGIIGPNGAGKSTTLKLLTKILKPSRGRCHVRGRTGALIEVAAGFHPDLTGRENVFLQGAIMGMKRTEIASHFDEIVEFAGVGDFIDTQVKRYSSGMNARLGFSIAAHLAPDALIIDEVLSVGDMGFQEKCVERMKEFKRRGVAIAFVSHNLQAISMLCDKALFVQQATKAYGPTNEVMESYVRASKPLVTRNSGSRLDIREATLRPPVPGGAMRSPGDRLSLRVSCVAHGVSPELVVVFKVIRTADGLIVYDANFSTSELGIDGFAGGKSFDIDFGFVANLTRGQYHIEVHVAEANTFEVVALLNPAAVFSIDEKRTYSGIADLFAQATTTD